MALPSAVTSRGDGNDFIATTGMVLTGITGFGIRTGFYLTNSGSHPIQTALGYNEGATPGIFEFPSGQNFTILPGKSKFIPFEMVFVQNNINGPMTSNYSTGPDTFGTYETFLSLNSTSQFDGQGDPEGKIRINVTGQVTGFQRVNSTGPWWTSAPAHPSGFLVTTDYARNGKPESILRWQHPSTGYYLTKYKLEYAGNIADSTVAGGTGSWTGLADFEINYEQEQYNGPKVTGPINYYKYATNTGIAQKYTRGTAPNPATPYGEHTVSDLGFNANYYYRIKSQYVDRDDSIYYESPYVYGYPIDNFEATVTDANVNGGLLSGSSTLSSSTDPSEVIANNTSDPQAMKIYFTKGQKDINLKTLFDAELSERGASVNSFDSTHADYAFTGVHFILPEAMSVGSAIQGQAGITTGGQLKYGSTEIKSVLELKKNSTVAGIGGLGGDGGYTDLRIKEDAANLQYRGRFSTIEKGDSDSSTDGTQGSPAIYINDTSIGELRIKKHPTAKIYGGGGGGGGGDPFFWPKAFTFNSNDTFQYEEFRNRNESSTISQNEEGSKVAVNTSDRSKSAGVVLTNKRSGQIQRITFTLADVVGTQLGGVGGGGQGFSTASGGASLKIKDGNVVATFSQTDGNFQKAGYASTAILSNKTSPGGNGGVFGQDGDDALDRDAGLLFQSIPNEVTGKGGLAGEGIKIITGNSEYSNLSSLLQYTDALTPTTANFPSLLAWFTSEDSSKITTSTVGSPAYKYISKWESKNDSSVYIDFPWTGTSNNNKPILIEAGTTLNSEAYTKPFNNQNVVFFAPLRKPTGGKVYGLVESGKLESNMSGFEIIYFIYPGSVMGDSPSVLATHGSWNLSAFRIFEDNNPEKALSGKFFVDGNGFRDRSNAPLGFGVADWTLNQPSMFYYTESNKNMSSEGTGLPDQKRAFFSDFTNGISPQRAWMYSVSGLRDGGGIEYKIHNDLKNIYTSTNEFRGLRRFHWRPIPYIGLNHGVVFPRYNAFHGGISDILVFKKRLTDTERSAVYSYIANKRLRVPTVKYHTVTSSGDSFEANLQERHIQLASTPEYITIGRKIIFSNGAVFTFTANAAQSGTPLGVKGKLTADLPLGTNGTLYPSDFDRNTLEMENGFAGFNEGPQW